MMLFAVLLDVEARKTNSHDDLQILLQHHAVLHKGITVDVNDERSYSPVN